MREDELFGRLEGGDLSALDELVRAYYPDILRYCRRHTPDASSAEDAAQETFLKAVRHLDAYVHSRKFRAWLYRIAANTCVDFWRRSQSPEPLTEGEYLDPGFARVRRSAGRAPAHGAVARAGRAQGAEKAAVKGVCHEDE